MTCYINMYFTISFLFASNEGYKNPQSTNHSINCILNPIPCIFSSSSSSSFFLALHARDFFTIPRLGAVSLLSQKSIGPASLGSLHRHLTFAYLEVGILSPPMHCAPAPGRIGGQAGPPQAYRHIHRHRQRATIIMAVVPPP